MLIKVQKFTYNFLKMKVMSQLLYDTAKKYKLYFTLYSKEN